jgi:phosphate starvation-inducible PhoH-like protein
MTESTNQTARNNGRSKIKIIVPDEHSMVALLGSRDELLNVVERAFNSDIHVRGNEITGTGRQALQRARVPHQEGRAAHP